MTYEAFPSGIDIAKFRFELDENKAASQGSFTRQLNSVTLSGGVADRWIGVIETSWLVDQDDIRMMAAFVTRIGRFGRFTFSHPTYDGAASGEIVGAVKGIGQSGKTLLVDGFTPSIQILAKGEFFQVRNGFHRATANSASDVAGEATLRFEPALRISPADNDPVDVSSPVMLLELLSTPSQAMKAPRRAQPFVLPFKEALIDE